jgi:peroxiredoxin
MKKGILIASAILLIVLLSLQYYLYLHRPSSPEELSARASQLPALDLTSIDGSIFRLQGGRPVVLMYFNSQCDHCQAQLNAMREQMNLFSSATIVFMSSQSLDELSRIAAIFDFIVFQNVHFVQSKPEQLSEKFGVMSLPQIFVYSAEGNLKKVFSGETAPSEIASQVH